MATRQQSEFAPRQKQEILQALSQIECFVFPTQQARDNTEAVLQSAFFWEQVERIAQTRARDLYQEIELLGDPTALDSEHQHMISYRGTTVALRHYLTNPSSRFNQELFIKNVSNDHGISLPDLRRTASVSKKETKPSVKTQVILVEDIDR